MYSNLVGGRRCGFHHFEEPSDNLLIDEMMTQVQTQRRIDCTILGPSGMTFHIVSTFPKQYPVPCYKCSYSFHTWLLMGQRRPWWLSAPSPERTSLAPWSSIQQEQKQAITPPPLCNYIGKVTMVDSKGGTLLQGGHPSLHPVTSAMAVLQCMMVSLHDSNTCAFNRMMWRTSFCGRS